jgi:hypothetical protein
MDPIMTATKSAIAIEQDMMLLIYYLLYYFLNEIYSTLFFNHFPSLLKTCDEITSFQIETVGDCNSATFYEPSPRFVGQF